VRWIGPAGVILLALAGCGREQVVRAPAPAGGSAPLVRKVDDFPLYEYTDRAPSPDVYVQADTTGWACTVFVAAGSGIVGRNFDFNDQPALILHHRPPGAYASVSMIDTEYLGLDREHIDEIAPERLARAARIPFDGMNEKGLVVTMAQVPQARSPDQPKTTGQLGVMRLALDQAANVDEAIAIFEKTAIDFSGDPPLHYLVADPSGASAVIEYIDGKVHVIRGGRVITNFVLTGSTPDERAHDRRYHTAAAALAAAGGKLDSAQTLDLLERVRQKITRWSVAYDMRHRTLEVVMGQRYGRVLRFSV
jgi:predicted choloylglycine hydrolase